MMTRSLVPICLAAFLLAGCQKTTVDKATAPQGQAAAPAANAPAKPAPAPTAEPAPASAPKAETLVGAKLTDAPVIKVVELLDNPAAHEGKLVAIEGNVAAMCHHRKLWFSVVDDDSGRQVRVLTHPAFLTPDGSIGRKVRVEGMVEKIEVPGERARHIAKEHGTADPEKIKGEVHHEGILRAKGARFR